MAYESLTIPISVEPRKQRTLKIIGFGIKAFLTAKISGKLIIRRKRDDEATTSGCKINPWPETPAVPNALGPAPIEADAEGDSQAPTMPTHFPEDDHWKLVALGIKVRDFAYPVNRLAHTTPVDPHPMALTKEAEGEFRRKKERRPPRSPEDTPMPSVSLTWEAPHPCLRPGPVLEGALLKAPTPAAPYLPIYATHRIPVPFSVYGALYQVIARLAQNPRTVPIRGLVTRRLLTLSPHLVDLSRYHEMDLEELRRYDRRILWQLMNGIEPYPWYSDRDPAWTPTEQTLQTLAKQSSYLEESDQIQQFMLLSYGHHRWLEDNAWQNQRLDELIAENARNGRVFGGEGEAQLGEYDRIISAEFGVTLRQYAAVWERRMDSDRATPGFDGKVAELHRIRAIERFERRQAGTSTGEDTAAELAAAEGDPYAGVVPPFILGQAEHELPRLPFWGPDAVWDGYRRYGGVETGKSINFYAAKYSRRVDDGAPWPPAPNAGYKRQFQQLGDDGTDLAAMEEDSEESGSEEDELEGGEAVPEEAGPSLKRARPEDDDDGSEFEFEEESPCPKRVRTG